MPRTFKIHGPFSVPLDLTVKKGKSIKIGCPDFWEQSELQKDLANECGCYVFGIRAGRGIKPIYVGKATRTFKGECFAPHKIAAHYHRALMNSSKGTPVMFLVVLERWTGTPGAAAKEAISRVEQFLIQNALRKNPSLSNIKGTKQENWSIDGVIRNRKGTASTASRSFRRALGV